MLIVDTSYAQLSDIQKVLPAMVKMYTTTGTVKVLDKLSPHTAIRQEPK